MIQQRAYRNVSSNDGLIKKLNLTKWCCLDRHVVDYKKRLILFYPSDALKERYDRRCKLMALSNQPLSHDDEFSDEEVTYLFGRGNSSVVVEFRQLVTTIFNDITNSMFSDANNKSQFVTIPDHILKRLKCHIAFDPTPNGSCLFGAVARLYYGSKNVENNISSMKSKILDSVIEYVHNECCIKNMKTNTKYSNKDMCDLIVKSLKIGNVGNVTIRKIVSLVYMFDKFGYYDADDNSSSLKSSRMKGLQHSKESTNENISIISKFIYWMIADVGGYMDIGIWGDQCDIRIISNILNVNILLIDLQTKLPFYPRSGRYISSSSFLSDIFTITEYIPCGNPNTVVSALTEEEGIDAILKSHYSSSSSKILLAENTILLGRLGKHYVSLDCSTSLRSLKRTMLLRSMWKRIEMYYDQIELLKKCIFKLQSSANNDKADDDDEESPMSRFDPMKLKNMSDAEMWISKLEVGYYVLQYGFILISSSNEKSELQC